MSGWWWLLAGAGVVAATALWPNLARRVRLPHEEWSVVRIGLGAAVTLTAIAAGGLLTEVRSVAPPEQRGIGVVVDGAQSRGDRGLDVGLTVSAAVRVHGCGDRVDVRLTIAPTAEFWIDNRTVLKDSAHVRVAVPDVGLDDVEVSTVGDALTLVAPLPEDGGFGDEAGQEPLNDFHVDEQGSSTLVTADVPHWGQTLRPLVLTFTADWTQRRSLLGACYVRLPALAGFPTVLSAAELTGAATDLDKDPGGDQGFFVVSSREAGLHTFYDPSLEVTRGVTSLTLGDFTLQEGVTLPGPDANFGGAPAWTCHTTIPDGLDAAERLDPGDPAPDLVLGNSREATLSFSSDRIDEILDQQTCASFVAIEGPGAGTKRDLVLIGIGALFSFGIELLLSGVRRRRRPEDPPAAAPRRPPSGRAGRTRRRS